MSGEAYWFWHDEAAWLPITLERKDDVITASCEKLEMEFEVTEEDITDLQTVHPSALMGVSNMIDLEDLNEGVILNTLRDRYAQDSIYTHISSILVSINPYQKLPIYGRDAMERVKDRDMNPVQLKQRALLRRKAGLPPKAKSTANIDPRGPHPYVLAAEVYKSFTSSGDSQSVIISGESGAGKTEATKLILQYLSFLSQNEDDELAAVTAQHRRRSSVGGRRSSTAGGDRGCAVADCTEARVGGKPYCSKHNNDILEEKVAVEQMIMEANPIVEAFGNAQTVRNNNSSRFGKWIEIDFDSSHCISGGSISHYLLEKSRVTTQAPGERNYHVFYQLCRSKHGGRDLLDPEEYRYLSQGDHVSIDGVDDGSEWQHTMDAFKALNFGEKDIACLCDTLVAILNLGQIPITADNGNEEKSFADVADANLVACANLIGVEAADLAEAVVSGTKKFGRDTVRVEFSVNAAQSNRDALGRHLYSKMFDWIIQTINTSLKTDKYIFGSIGVLDIFGFEIFETNRLEQFLINYANEKLQTHFNHFVFELEQEEYQREGLELPYVDFKDNKPCVLLIEKAGTGIIPMLDEELKKPKGTDETYLDALHHKQRGSLHYKAPRVKSSVFTVVHYAGDVTYSVDGFLEKNKDTLSDSLLTLLGKSEINFFSKLFVEAEEKPKEAEKPSRGRAAPKANKRTLGNQFSKQLIKLMDKIEGTSPHFIRCIKPNEQKKPSTFDGPMICRQLRYAGVQAVVQVRKAGFPFRMLHQDFFKRFRCLSPTPLALPDDTEEAELPEEERPIGKDSVWGGASVQLLDALEFDPKWFGIGYTKVLVTHEKHLALEKMRDTKYLSFAVTLQAGWRARVARVRFGKLKGCLLALRSCQEKSKALPLQDLLGTEFLVQLDDALADALAVSLPAPITVRAEMEELKQALVKKEVARRGLARAAKSEAEELDVFDNALQAADNAGDDLKTLAEYKQCTGARQELVELLEQRRREEEERIRLEKQREEEERLRRIEEEKQKKIDEETRKKRAEADAREKERKEKEAAERAEKERVRKEEQAKRAAAAAAEEEANRQALEEELAKSRTTKQQKADEARAAQSRNRKASAAGGGVSADAQKIIDDLMRKNKRLEKENKDMEGMVTSMNTDLQSKHREILNYKSQVKNMENKYMKEIKDQKSTISKQKKKIREQRSRIEKLESDPCFLQKDPRKKTSRNSIALKIKSVMTGKDDYDPTQ